MDSIVLLLVGAVIGVILTALANAASCRDCELRINTTNQEGANDDIEQ